jgi:hypothetical protein
MNRRVLARIKVMTLTFLFIGGFTAINPSCHQETHAGVDVDEATAAPSPDLPRP